MRLMREAPSRNRDVLASDIATLVRREKGDKRGDIVRRAEFRRQYVALDHFLKARDRGLKRWRQDNAGRDRIAADVLLAVLGGDIFRQRFMSLID